MRPRDSLVGLVYGFQVEGLADTRALLAPDGCWPSVEVVQAGPESPIGSPFLSETHALLELDALGRRLELDRDARVARFYGPRLEPDEMIHPYVGPVVTVFSRWLGRETFHAGAFVVDGFAYALVGDKGAGKSTLLAAMSAAGIAILADDLVIVEQGLAFAGPRALDLRVEPPPSLTTGMEVGRVRGGSRWRITLPGVAPAVQLGGWVFLAAGDRVETVELAGRDLLQRLIAWRGWSGLPSDQRALLELAALPAWVLSRPLRWETLPSTVEAVLGAVSGAAQDGPQIGGASRSSRP